MQKLGAVRRALDAGELDIVLSRLKYGGSGRDKVANVLEGFARSFGADEERPVVLCSAPGRTEICGNHTDHQRGRVLAGAVDLDFLACASPNGTDRIRFQSEGWPLVEIGLDELLPKADERETTVALVRGMAGLVAERGYKVAGFDAYAVSEVLPGSGLSSSAACEVLLGVIENCLFCGGELDAVTIAQLGQRAENVYFGKPSGLMDQMASSAGGLVYIDFQNDDPEVREISYDFAAKGYALVVVNSGGSHDNLTEFYAAIPQEMRAVAACFGETYLRRVQPEQFMQMVPQLRERLKNVNADRAILRAAHYFAENRRVADEVSALQADDLNAFLRLVIESGRSSFCYLQNIFATPDRQELSLALMLAESKLHKDGAWRVHGGGFAGTTLNFVPKRSLDSFVKEMEAVFGAHSCNVLDIRPVGPACIRLGL